MTAFTDLLTRLRDHSRSEREKGTYFEHVVQIYLTHEPYYADIYGDRVWLWEDWRQEWMIRGNNDPGPDAGIDLVAETADGELHAVQSKFYAEGSHLALGDVATFLAASGKKHFSRRFIVLTASDATHHLRNVITDQSPPVHFIFLSGLEGSKIDWSSYFKAGNVQLKESKQLRPYQEKAINDVKDGLKEADRGKLIMACGTGKTFTALKLAEDMAGKGGNVLFLVPSLNLLSQTLTEWTQEATIPVHSYAICSDSKVGKKQEDDFEMQLHELQYPATTSASSLAGAFAKRNGQEHMNVVYSTYHSIDVISQAQKEHDFPEFDLIICDEAHRTTGATFEGDAESTFVRIHNPDFIKGKKRVYMTATPRVYGAPAKAKAGTDNITLYSMDDETQYGQTLHMLTFSEAVHNLQILSDYKVIVLTVNEEHVADKIELQRLLSEDGSSLNVSDAAKIIGCWRALTKMDMQDDLEMDPAPMKRAVAFCQVIEVTKAGRAHKVSSKNIAEMFQQVVDRYRQSLIAKNPENPDEISRLQCEVRHVDGSMNALEKDQRLGWLKSDVPQDTCHILSNVRVLSEGVDVPALDAVMFMTPRNSQVEVVQSVGRVMRKPPSSDKKLGYVILPVVIPANKTPEEALNDNRTYRVVWQVLQALRAHDDRFNIMMRRLELAGPDRSKMEIIAVTDRLPVKNKKGSPDPGRDSGVIGKKPGTSPVQLPLPYGNDDSIERAIIAKIVQKVGDNTFWHEWAADIANIAQTHIARIAGILKNEENVEEIAAFEAFLREIRSDLNDSITQDDAIEMLAQHMITRPVFDALFEDYKFTQHNPVSQALQRVLEVLDRHHIEKEAQALGDFYENVRLGASGITDIRAKQQIIVELYDRFFRNAFPKMTERLGIVYTPVEVVDFIIHSVNDVLQSEFGQTLGSKNVHIIDPFTGTGTFITRLLQSGLIEKEELVHKYKNEIHANEIVLLAYYIAAINIEQVYHDIMGGDYVPFDGICLTDTFAMHEKDDLVNRVLEDNSARRKRQRKLDIRVIMGNPPYSAGQKSEDDNNKNIAYLALDERIKETYAASSSAVLQKNLYDSYIRSLRWASDRIGQSGVVGFVSNASFIDANAMDGLRKCLVEEFSSIHVFHLRGNQRTSGELSRREGGKIFGGGSRAPIAISIMVKNPNAKEHGRILFHDIGDYLSREEKLEKITEFGSIAGIASWQHITPDKHHDWIGQRDGSFEEFISLGDKKSKNSVMIFENYSQGVLTARDAWVYNFSKKKLSENMKSSIGFYNAERTRYQTEGKSVNVNNFLTADTARISWTVNIKADLSRNKTSEFQPESLITGLYRPFSKQWVYFNRQWNERVYQMPRIFPDSSVGNRVICVTGRGEKVKFSVLMVDAISEFKFHYNSQCFPLKLYEPTNDGRSTINIGATPQPELFDDGPIGLFDVEPSRYTVRDGITDDGLQHFQKAYLGRKISKDDIFYYIYGLLHSEEYKARYADNLSKELPRIPAVKKYEDFVAFSEAGRKLAELHVNYESVAPYPVELKLANPQNKLAAADYRVTQMRFAKGTGSQKHDRSTVIYNHAITITNIPLEAYDYVVNGRPALEWVMERQAVTTHKDSGIVNDANDWAIETMGDPTYPLKLFQSVITVSLETMKIVSALPELAIDTQSFE